jgi:hypothetical protein
LACNTRRRDALFAEAVSGDVTAGAALRRKVADYVARELGTKLPPEEFSMTLPLMLSNLIIGSTGPLELRPAG